MWSSANRETSTSSGATSGDALVERFGFERLCQLAAEKDPGFSLTVLAEMLSGFGRYMADDLELDAANYERLARAVAGWQRALAGHGDPGRSR